jgi:hypothetical protein
LKYLSGDPIQTDHAGAMDAAKEIEAEKKNELRKTFGTPQGLQSLRVIEKMCLHNDDSLQGNLEPNPTIMAQREGMRAVYRNLVLILGRDWIANNKKGTPRNEAGS